jgi:hypothetical protein
MAANDVAEGASVMIKSGLGHEAIHSAATLSLNTFWRYMRLMMYKTNAGFRLTEEYLAHTFGRSLVGLGPAPAQWVSQYLFQHNVEVLRYGADAYNVYRLLNDQ